MWKRLPAALTASTFVVFVLQSCGGGSDGPAEPPPPQLSAQLSASGTYVRCEGAGWNNLQLVRTENGVSSVMAQACPGTRLLPNDFGLSTWKLQVVNGDTKEVRVLATATTRLPDPVLVAGTSGWTVLPTVAQALPALANAELVQTDASGVSRSFGLSATIDRGTQALAAASGGSWQLRITQGGTEFTSAKVAETSYRDTNFGFWGAMAVGDVNGDGSSELLGTLAATTGITAQGYGAQGLTPLLQSRDFRDVRVVDLNDDGRADIVANVYGNGCTLIGIAKTGGGYDFSQPLRADGSCIGGHGETILVADFDQDGLIDIFLPSYQRFDYLRNLGGGKFEEIADALGISYPSYLPTVEGATAVDLNLDGSIDIVVANEILMNDGQGRFTPRAAPFGPVRVADEGQSVYDLDRDGVFDIIKHSPERGPRVYWGGPDRLSFSDAGFMLGGEKVLDSAYGVAVGHLTGGAFGDIVFAGGVPAGNAPTLCVQPTARQFRCIADALPTISDAWQDLLMITDLDADGKMDLVARYGTLRMYPGAAPVRNVFRIDLRDAQGRRIAFGHTLRAVCTVDKSLVGLGFVDGGNGYMSQTDYVVTFTSDWCPSVNIELATRSGLKTFGPFAAGTQARTISSAL